MFGQWAMNLEERRPIEGRCGASPAKRQHAPNPSLPTRSTAPNMSASASCGRNECVRAGCELGGFSIRQSADASGAKSGPNAQWAMRIRHRSSTERRQRLAMRMLGAAGASEWASREAERPMAEGAASTKHAHQAVHDCGKTMPCASMRGGSKASFPVWCRAITDMPMYADGRALRLSHVQGHRRHLARMPRHCQMLRPHPPQDNLQGLRDGLNVARLEANR